MNNATDKNLKMNPSLRIAVCIALISVFSLSAFSIANADNSKFVNEEYAHINEDGKIYGVPYEGEEGTVIMPDMVNVRATNGVYGYISQKEMDAAVLDYASNDSEMMASISNTAKMKSEALSDVTTKTFGQQLLNESLSAETIDLLMHENGVKNAREYVTENTQDALYKLVTADVLDDNITTQLLVDAIEIGAISDNEIEESIKRASCSIENLVSSSSKSKINANATVDEKINTLLSLSIEEKALALAKSKAFDCLNASDISISEALFKDIYQKCQHMTSVFIPVYDEDGTTIIGEYEVYRM